MPIKTLPPLSTPLKFFPAHVVITHQLIVKKRIPNILNQPPDNFLHISTKSRRKKLLLKTQALREKQQQPSPKPGVGKSFIRNTTSLSTFHFVRQASGAELLLDPKISPGFSAHSGKKSGSGVSAPSIGNIGRLPVPAIVRLLILGEGRGEGGFGSLFWGLVHLTRRMLL